MPFLKAILGGVIGGLIGAAIWAVLVYFIHYEIGYVAWGVGFLVGLGVRMGADDLDGYVPGVIAATLAIAAVCGGKYAAATIMAHDLVGKVRVVASEASLQTADANDLVEQRTAAGRPVVWRNGKNAETAESLADFPKDIEQEVMADWAKLSPEQRAARVTEQQQRIDSMRVIFEQGLRKSLFMASFGMMDIVFFILATITAFKLGSGMSTDT